jgi:hypothetical protein
MALKVLGFDGGHEIEKWITAQAEGCFRHAMHDISDADYDYIKLRTNGKPPVDFVKINGQPYVIGDAAEDYGPVTKKVGAARYKPEYIGHMMVGALVRAYATGGEVEVVASHPPRDITYRDNLMDALLGTWKVESEGSERTYEVIKVSAYDEPQGGLMYNILTDDGLQYQNVEVAEGKTLVFDCGGGTCSMIAADPGGWVNPAFRPDTIQLGIMNVLQDFETAIKDEFADEFQDVTTIDPERLRNALSTGIFTGGGEEIPCHRQAQAAKNRLLSQIQQRYQQRAGGPKNWDAILLTGGGTGMLYTDLVKLFNHRRTYPAGELHDIHMANVRGLRRLRNYYKNYGKANG